MFLLTAIGPLAAIRAAADELDRHDPSPAEAVSWFEEASGRFRLEIYTPTEQDADSARAVVGAAAPDLHLHGEAAPQADWVAQSLAGLPPVFAGRFVVAGAHALPQTGGRTRIWIEASEAFGTGHHGSTRGCLMALEQVLRRRRVRSVLDLGAGSGVLAIAAAKSGARALAIELDRRAAAVAAENVRLNGVSGRVRVRCGDAARARGRHDVVFANILMRPLIRLAATIARAPGGTAILSGLLRSQAPLVRLAYEGQGFVLQRRAAQESWATLTLVKPRAP
jgi:ribosomal protein L11 methyltransferase